jgi:hypothetical protein
MDSGERLIVGERFCGPPGVGNGGYVAGLVAGRLGGQAEVSLRRPTPLGTALSLRRASGAWRLESGAGELLVEGRPLRSLRSLPTPPPAPHFEQAAVASKSAPAAHPFPRCFVCGPAREAGDGLRILAGPVLPDCHAVVAAPWTPDASQCADGERVDVAFLWAALDCPGAMVAMEDRPRPVLLARMAAAVSGRVRRGERCVVIGWRIARDGRKHTTGTALYGADGTLHGASEQLWIEPRSAAA